MFRLTRSNSFVRNNVNLCFVVTSLTIWLPWLYENRVKRFVHIVVWSHVGNRSFRQHVSSPTCQFANVSVRQRVSSPTTSSVILKSIRQRQNTVWKWSLANWHVGETTVIHASPSTDIRRWRIDFKISELVVGEQTRWRNDRNSSYHLFCSSLALGLNSLMKWRRLSTKMQLWLAILLLMWHWMESTQVNKGGLQSIYEYGSTHQVICFPGH